MMDESDYNMMGPGMMGQNNVFEVGKVLNNEDVIEKLQANLHRWKLNSDSGEYEPVQIGWEMLTQEGWVVCGDDFIPTESDFNNRIVREVFDKPMLRPKGINDYINNFISPYLGNTISFTELDNKAIYDFLKDVSKDLAAWLINHKKEYVIHSKYFDYLHDTAINLIHAQAMRSNKGFIAKHTLGSQSYQVVRHEEASPRNPNEYNQEPRRKFLGFI